jgi:hypothetical protein
MMGWASGWGGGNMFGIAHLLWWVLLIVAAVLVARWLFEAHVGWDALTRRTARWPS